MRFKKFTAALLAGILMTFSMAGTAFAYTGETEPAENSTEANAPYKVTVSEDGTYTFTLGDYEWSFNPENGWKLISYSYVSWQFWKKTMQQHRVLA